MAEYRGLIKFIGLNEDFALVEESRIYQNDVTTSTGIGTGDASNRTFSGTLTPVVEEGDVSIKVAGAAINASDSGGSITGSDITTSTGLESTINYADGEISITTTVGATPGSSEAVVAAYEYSALSEFPEGLKLIKGDFSGFSVGDYVGYSYDAETSQTDGYYVTEIYTT